MSIIDCCISNDSDPYIIQIKNRSTSQLYFTCFQPIHAADTSILAWFAEPLAIKTDGYFIWHITYDMIWANTGLLEVGSVVRAGQLLSVQLSSSNETILIRTNGAYQFGPKTDGTPNNLTIKTDGTIPNNSVSIGTGMSHQPTMALQALPNLQTVFTLPQPPKYTVAFSSSKIQKGQLLDCSALESASCAINFPINQFGVIAELTEDNTWNVDYKRSIDVI